MNKSTQIFLGLFLVLASQSALAGREEKPPKVANINDNVLVVDSRIPGSFEKARDITTSGQPFLIIRSTGWCGPCIRDFEGLWNTQRMKDTGIKIIYCGRDDKDNFFARLGAGEVGGYPRQAFFDGQSYNGLHEGEIKTLERVYSQFPSARNIRPQVAAAPKPAPSAPTEQPAAHVTSAAVALPQAVPAPKAATRSRANVRWVAGSPIQGSKGHWWALRTDGVFEVTDIATDNYKTEATFIRTESVPDAIRARLENKPIMAAPLANRRAAVAASSPTCSVGEGTCGASISRGAPSAYWLMKDGKKYYVEDGKEYLSETHEGKTEFVGEKPRGLRDYEKDGRGVAVPYAKDGRS